MFLYLKKNMFGSSFSRLENIGQIIKKMESIKKIKSAIFSFNESSNYFVVCDLLLAFPGYSLRNPNKFRAFFASFFLLFYYVFRIQDIFNFLIPFNLDMIMSGLGLSIIYIMAAFKFAVTVIINFKQAFTIYSMINLNRYSKGKIFLKLLISSILSRLE